MINYNEIRTSCPKATIEWFAWTIETPASIVQENYHSLSDDSFGEVIDIIKANQNPRDLYDFFDGQGVFVSVYRTLAGRWLYKFDGCPDVIWGYPTRAEAEAAAFTAAFGVLETRLNEQGK